MNRIFFVIHLQVYCNLRFHRIEESVKLQQISDSPATHRLTLNILNLQLGQQFSRTESQSASTYAELWRALVRTNKTLFHSFNIFLMGHNPV